MKSLTLKINYFGIYLQVNSNDSNIPGSELKRKYSHVTVASGVTSIVVLSLEQPLRQRS